jgi:hypothetical protein
MASVIISGDTSGSVTLSAPTVAGSTTQTLVAATGTLAPIVSGTAVASTSGTAIDFTGIPSWVKRITVMFQSVSTSGTSAIQIQLGTSGGIITTGYLSRAYGVTTNTLGSTTGLLIVDSSIAAGAIQGLTTICNISGNAFVQNALISDTTSPSTFRAAGSVTLSGTLDRVRITTVNGTDTFDAGSINIMYE